MAKTTTTRRALLGAISAAPIAATILTAPAAATSPADRAKWDTALRNFTAADDAMNAFDRDHLTPVSHAYSQVRDKWPIRFDFSKDPEAAAEIARASAIYDPVQERFDALVDLQDDACKALLLTPAPSFVEFTTKLDIAVQQEVYNWTEARRVLETIGADARRLAGEV